MPEPPIDDPGVLAAARAGSREALGRALEAHRRYLLALAEGQIDADVRAKGGASDLVQETFLEAQRDFGQFRGATADEFRAWLRQTLLHNAGAFTRRFRATGMRAVRREIAVAADDSSRGLDAALAGSTISPSGAVMKDEQVQVLKRALALLPEEYQKVITLRNHESKSFEEVGLVLDRSPDAARKLWSRAMLRLREVWETLS
jgi:RNA polymerase sigma-70 factor, ECF subfamily